MTATTRLTRAAVALWGDAWPWPMSHATGLNVRTLQRIRGAAVDGEDHPSAIGALAATREVLGHVIDQLGEPD